MILRKREYPLPKTRRQWGFRTWERGQAEWCMGLFVMLFLAVTLCSQLQVTLYYGSAQYMEDALAASNLASAVVDMKEYGRTHRVLVTDWEGAYNRFCEALKGNLQLDEAWKCENKQLISGTVSVENYIIYNVEEEMVKAYRVLGQGGVVTWQGRLGEMKAPNGIPVEGTGVYSEISYDVMGFGGVLARAHKGKLVDIVMNGK